MVALSFKRKRNQSVVDDEDFVVLWRNILEGMAIFIIIKLRSR